MAAFKTTPQILGLTREDHPQGKHRANGMGICLELGEERASKSNTLDRSLSHMNIYEGFERGQDCWEAMCKSAGEYRSHYTDKNGRECKRKLRSNAVIGFALVLRAPCDVCRYWDDPTYQKFYEDSLVCLCEIEPRLFRKSNIRMTAEHYDEGLTHDGRERHLHVVGECLDENGNYCGNLIDPKLLVEINRRFPELMRSKGWEVEDLDTTDWKKFNKDEQYRQERKQVLKDKGLDVNKYRSRKLEENFKMMDKILGKQLLDKYTAKEATFDAEIKRKQAKADADIKKKYENADKNIAKKTADSDASIAEQQMFLAKQRQDVAKKDAEIIRKSEELEEERRKALQDIARLREEAAKDIERQRKEAQDNIQGMYKRADDQIAERHQKYMQSLTDDEIVEKYKEIQEKRASERAKDADELMDGVTDNLNTNKVARRIEEMKNASVSTPRS